MRPRVSSERRRKHRTPLRSRRPRLGRTQARPRHQHGRRRFGNSASGDGDAGADAGGGDGAVLRAAADCAVCAPVDEPWAGGQHHAVHGQRGGAADAGLEHRGVVCGGLVWHGAWVGAGSEAAPGEFDQSWGGEDGAVG